MGLGIKDIAKLANVSAMTVSRAINTPEKVKPETRRRIGEIIDTYGYTQNTFARALCTGRTCSVGLLIVYDIHMFPDAIIPPVLKGASDIFTENGYSMMLLFDRHDGRNNLVSRTDLTEERMDGLIILSVDSDLEATYRLSDRIAGLKIPTVVVNQKPELPDISCVTADDFGGGKAAARYILEKGHRRIGIISGSDQFYTSRERLRGYRAALEEYGIGADDSYRADGNYTAEGGYAAMRELLGRHRDITAVLCASDLMASGAMNRLREEGLSVPRDISVIGYDDREFASMLSPALTTVRKDREQMGRKAAAVIMDRLNGPDRETRRLLIPTEIIERKSAGTVS